MATEQAKMYYDKDISDLSVLKVVFLFAKNSYQTIRASAD